MSKKGYEALAFLRTIRNVKKGLMTRSKIIAILKHNKSTTKEMAEKINMSYSAIRRQLKLMEREKIVRKIGKKWNLTGYGQREITDFVKAENNVSQFCSSSTCSRSISRIIPMRLPLASNTGS